MDMTKFLKRYLNNAALEQMDDRFEDVIDDVVEEVIRNPYNGNKQPEPVLVFMSNWRLIPNVAMRRALIGFFGEDSADWIGRRVVVYRRPVQRVDAKTGEQTTRFEKAVMLPDSELAGVVRNKRGAR